MSDLRETIYFWLAFGILAPVILRRFYFQKGKKQIRRLRVATIGLQLLALVLLFSFPWHFLLPVYGAALAGAIFFIAGKNVKLNKVGAAIALANSVWLFIMMFLLFPETKKLTSTDIAPIISVLLMLSNNMAVLLLWHQLQKGRRKRKF